MQTKARFWMIVCVLVLGLGTTLLWQRSRFTALRHELAVLHHERTAWGRLDAEHARLLAMQVPELELLALRNDREALNRLRSELEVLKLAAAESGDAAASSIRPTDSPAIPASSWKHAGRATPSAALETVLWAGLNGNADVMSAALAFESEEARTRALALMASLPLEAYDHRGSPERLIALLTADDIAYDSMRVVGEKEPDEEIVRTFLPTHSTAGDMMAIGVELLARNDPAKTRTLAMEESTNGAGLVAGHESARNKLFFLQRSGDGWKLLVPTAAVDKYTSRLLKAQQ